MNFRERFIQSLKIVSLVFIGTLILFLVVGIFISNTTPVDREVKSQISNTLDIPSSTSSKRYPGADYVTETFVGDGVTKIFKLKKSYTDVEARVNGRMVTMAMWGNCATVDICYDINGARLIFQEVPAKDMVIIFTGVVL